MLKPKCFFGLHKYTPERFVCIHDRTDELSVYKWKKCANCGKERTKIFDYKSTQQAIRRGYLTYSGYIYLRGGKDGKLDRCTVAEYLQYVKDEEARPKGCMQTETGWACSF